VPQDEKQVFVILSEHILRSSELWLETFIFPSCKNLALRLIFLQLSTYLQTNIKMAGLLGGGGGNNNGNGGGGLLGG
jgi:hypothetical protein